MKGQMFIQFVILDP